MKSSIRSSLYQIAALHLVFLIGVSSASAQTAQFCPDADKYYREAGILELDCSHKQGVVAKYNASLSAINQTLVASGLPSAAARKYKTEKNLVTSRLNTAQRSANSICASLANKLKTADAARAKCSTTPTPTPTKTPTPTPTATPTVTPNPVTAYCPLGIYTETNALGKVSVCKRGKLVSNGGCWYIEEEYHQNLTTFNAALANPRLAIYWSGVVNGSYQINFSYFLPAIPTSACVN